MDRIITAQEAKEICKYERLLPTFRRIYSASLHCLYDIKEERLYKNDVEKLIELGYRVQFLREHHSGVSEYNISWF